MTLRWLAGTVGAVCLCAAGDASAAVGLALSAPANTPDIGKVVYGSSGVTTFTVSTAGAVTQSGGNAIRLTSGGVTLPTITITCGDDNDCNTKDINVTVTASTANPRIKVSQFTMTALTGTTVRSGTTSGSSLSFRLNDVTKNSTITFKLAMQLQVQPGAASGTGDKTAAYTVSVAFN